MDDGGFTRRETAWEKVDLGRCRDCKAPYREDEEGELHCDCPEECRRCGRTPDREGRCHCGI